MSTMYLPMNVATLYGLLHHLSTTCVVSAGGAKTGSAMATDPANGPHKQHKTSIHENSVENRNHVGLFIIEMTF